MTIISYAYKFYAFISKSILDDNCLPKHDDAIPINFLFSDPVAKPISNSFNSHTVYILFHNVIKKLVICIV